MQESSSPMGPAATASRTVVLTQGHQMTEAALRVFLESGGGGQAAAELRINTIAAAEALNRAHDSVTSSLAARLGGFEEPKGNNKKRWGEELVETEREDAAARVCVCQKVVGEWWGQERRAVEEELRDRERETEERR